MRLILLALAILTFFVALVLGFGFATDPEHVEDYPGWIALGLFFFACSFVPWDKAAERWHR